MRVKILKFWCRVVAAVAGLNYTTLRSSKNFEPLTTDVHSYPQL